MGVPGSGSPSGILAFNFCGLGATGQRWLLQLKPDPLGGLRLLEDGIDSVALPKGRAPG